MAIGATAVWRVRPAGNDLNGAGYDPAITGGTDYSQQDAPQASFAATLSTSAANSTTLLNSANTFTSAMVGNALQLASGTNAIAGWYFVTAFASAGSVTLDRTPATAGALASGTGRLGGGCALPATILAGPVVPGNQVYIAGLGVTGWTETTLAAAITSTSATSCTVASSAAFPAAPFFAQIDLEVVRVTAVSGTTWTITRAQKSTTAATHVNTRGIVLVHYSESLSSQYTPNSGSTTVGMVAIIGENGTPCIGSNVRWHSGTNYVSYTNIAVITSGGFDGNGVLLGSNYRIRKCFFNAAGSASCMAYAQGSCLISESEFYGGITPLPSGTTGIAMLKSDNGTTFTGNYIHHVQNDAIVTGGGGDTIIGNVIARCNGNGVNCATASSSDRTAVIAYNTIDNVTNDAIQMSGATPSANSVCLMISSNCITNSGRYGLNMVNGSSTLNSSIRGLVDLNNVWNSTTANYNNIAAGASDASVDPGYVDSTDTRNPNYSIGTALKAAGFPSTVWTSGMRSYFDIGAIQRQEPASSVLRRPQLFGVG